MLFYSLYLTNKKRLTEQLAQGHRKLTFYLIVSLSHVRQNKIISLEELYHSKVVLVLNTP